MRQPPAHVRRSRLVVVSAAVLVAAAWSLGPGSPAVAHDALIGTDPADGAVLDAAPSQVVLTFAAEQAGVGAEVVVSGPEATTWSDGDAVTSGTIVTQPLAPGMPDGAYTVAWRSVAQDGHPVTGAITFSVDGPGEGPEPTDDATTREPATTETDPEAPGDATDTEAGGGGWWTAWHTTGAALVVVLAVVATALVRRSPRG